MTELIDIGDVIARSGLPATTLHVWERRGLIAVAGRRGIRRQYPADILDRLATIVVLKGAGFRLDEIAALLAPDAFDDGKHRLEAKILELQATRTRLDRAIDGLTHALECPNPVPLDCPGFQQHVADALPVSRNGERDAAPSGSADDSLGYSEMSRSAMFEK
ncbi:MerR family transcriptional regulator [Ilumatobacter coccineus]|uniref:Putative MerR family transcriptional regulator n=1 Tax=Ilumatobacter coccineus (strain NBRC 103263 / KCTC 29153 / YM16-304) TaxID=1313172 RepID=A0A6C7EBG4_ILUCY|nr:MerR family transcriptional regulator [Ilumatobacter coccineus]BAN01978.1 putative MerR family transcriptional regulator [Ilumatobacter coccineus YM16-304]